MNCKYHPKEKATHIFKAHAPVIDGDPQKNKEYAHWCNQFLCDGCVHKTRIRGRDGKIWRYARVRTSPRATDRLVDNWEKEWILLYGTDTEWIYVEPSTFIYYVTAPEYDEKKEFVI